MNSEDLKLDIQELELLLTTSTRPKVKDCLSNEIKKLKTMVQNLEKKTNAIVSDGPKCYQVKISNYAWDQTSKFVKLYVTLKNVQSLPSENISCQFTTKSVELYVKALGNKDYVLTIKNLLEEIEISESFWKVKSDLVIVSLSKKKLGNWSHITTVEKKASESKVPKFDDEDSKDPSASLMNMMKKMYETGDDEMKRTIAKTWTERRENQDMNMAGI